MKFKDIVKQIPYYKIKPEQYNREDWYYFAEDEEIFWEDTKILLEDSPIKEKIISHVRNFRTGVIYHKEDYVNWIMSDLHNLYI